MLLAILAFYFGYKKGKDSGRGGLKWSLISGFTFIGVQLLTALGAGIIIGIGIELWGWKETAYDDMSWVISLIAIVLSVIPLWLIFRYLDRVPDEPDVEAPPPPPDFSRGSND
jgi:MFS family permease